jgi:hypothetical protein
LSIQSLLKTLQNKPPSPPHQRGTLFSTPFVGGSTFTKFFLKRQEISADFERISKVLKRAE